MNKESIDEWMILARYALIFDGYSYRDRTGFNLQEGLSRLETHGDFSLFSDLELRAIMFWIQRVLRHEEEYKQVLTNTPTFKVYRELFLRLAPLKIPDEYRGFYGSGTLNPADDPFMPDKIATVRAFHESTHYQQPKPRRP